MNAVIKYEPVKGILDRDLAIASNKAIIDKYSPYLKELTNYGTALMTRCEKSLGGCGGTPLSLIALFYHTIQMTDGFQVLISKSCFSASVPLLRSLLESVLSLEYMLEDDFEARSAAWLVKHYVDRKRSYFAMDPATEEGKKFQQLLKADKFACHTDLKMPSADDIKKEIDQIDEMLARPKFKEICRLFKGKNRIKKWYQINNGPKSLEELANQLHRPIDYNMFYRDYSSISHALDCSRIVEKLDDAVVFTPIRSARSSGDQICI